MTNIKAFRSAVCAALSMLGVGSASATLLDRGPDLVYDDVLNITWTRNAHLPSSSGLTWAAASTWAGNLAYAGFDDWRLPWASVSEGAGPTLQLAVNCQTATESACRDNEMGYMFYYNLGGIFGQNKSGTQTAVGGQVLTDIQSLYWSGTQSGTLSSSFDAWDFVFFNGDQFRAFKSTSGGGVLSAWAVRDGDVAPSQSLKPTP